jgi:hypothetical protein
MRYRVAAGITIAIASLSIALIAEAEFGLLIGMAAAAAIGITWASAFRLRTVAGACAGLLICVLTPAMDEPLLGRAIVFVVFGSLAGFSWDLLVTSWPTLKP